MSGTNRVPTGHPKGSVQSSLAFASRHISFVRADKLLNSSFIDLTFVPGLTKFARLGSDDFSVAQKDRAAGSFTDQSRPKIGSPAISMKLLTW